MVSRWVWGHVQTILWFDFKMCSAGVLERTICQTTLWFFQTMLWVGHKRGVPGQLGAGYTRMGSEFALEGSKDFGLFAWCARVLWVKTRERPPSVHING